MSDVMLMGVLRMPYEMAMNDELSRVQFYGRAQQAADRIETDRDLIDSLQAKVAELEKERDKWTHGAWWDQSRQERPAPAAVFQGYVDGIPTIKWTGNSLPVGTRLVAAIVDGE